MLKRFLNSPAGSTLIGKLIGIYVFLAEITTRWTDSGRDVVIAQQKAGGPVIVCFWHNRLLLSRRLWPHRRQKFGILISQSRDGDAIAEAARTIGLGAIRGSSAKAGKSKGVMAAFREMLSDLHEGKAVGITPDGPRGPRMRAQMGAIQLAKRTGAPIICVSWSQPKRKVMPRSWDHHVVPALFQRGVMMWDGPIHVAKSSSEEELEAKRLEVEVLLNRLSDEADRRAGVTPIIPATLSDAPAPEPAET
ncbi:MAG: lysophospholipid acyltransferase family protein [Caulobacterales bacterium]